MQPPPPHPLPHPDPQRAKGPDAAERARQFYDALRSVARMMLAGEKVNLGATELANETWIHRASKLFDTEKPGVAYAMMREWTFQTLIDLVRAQKALIRGGGRLFFPIDESLADVPVEVRRCDTDDLSAALNEFREIDPLGYQVVSLRVFGGLKMAEIAKVLHTSLSEVEREWAYARAWLKSRLTDPNP